MENKRVSLQMYMSSETRRKLRKLAADRDVSVNDLIRQAAQKTFDAEGIGINLAEGLDTWGGAGRKTKGEESE